MIKNQDHCLCLALVETFIDKFVIFVQNNYIKYSNLEFFMFKKRAVFCTFLAAIVISASILFYFHHSFTGHIHTIYSLQEAESELIATSPNTFVVFDVDDTLIVPESAVFFVKKCH